MSCQPPFIDDRAMPQHTPGIPAGGYAISSALTTPFVWLSGDAVAVMYVRRVLHASGLLNSPLRLRMAETAGTTRLAIYAGQERYHLYWRPEMHGNWFEWYSGNDINPILESMQQVARWHTLVRLENSFHSSIDPDDISFDLFTIHSVANRLVFQPCWSMHQSGSDAIHLPGEVLDRTMPQSICEVRLSTRPGAARPLYVALFALTENYGIASLLSGACRRLEPGERTRVRLAGNVPADCAAAGLTQTSTLLKLLVRTCAFDVEHVGSIASQEPREQAVGQAWQERAAASPGNWFTSHLRVHLGETASQHKE